MNKDELKQILENHKKWIKSEPDGKLADLREADLRGADLRGANLQGAYLRGADLCGANLQDAALEGANLLEADLRGANLRGANIKGADLRRAVLRDADLRGADLRWVNMRVADIKGADLRGVDLRGADTNGMKADTETKLDWPMACPETGSFIAWKKALEYNGYIKKCSMIVKLEIPEDAKRSSAMTNKCRASKARVLEIQNMDGTKADKTEVKSIRGTTYKLGEMVYPDRWDNNRWNECSYGIHFFMTRDEAVEW